VDPRYARNEATVVFKIQTRVEWEDAAESPSVHVPADINMVSGSGEAGESSNGTMLYFENIVRGRISTAACSVGACEESADNLCHTVTKIQSWSIIASNEEADRVGRDRRSGAC
jgi:hypothetical protein